MSDPHTGFIFAAYGVAALIVVAMIAALVIDHRRLRGALDRLIADSPDGEER